MVLKTKNKRRKKKKNIFGKKFSSYQSIFFAKLYKILPYLTLAAFVFLLDQLSKYYVVSFIPRMNHETQWYPYNGIGLFSNFFGIEFSIVHSINKGAAWGMLSDFQEYIMLFRIVFVSVFFIYIIFFNDNKSFLIPFILILTGAIGNILDYFIYGHVIDMLYVVLWGYDYPVFNVADSAIVIGIFYVFIVSCIPQKKLKKSKN